MSHRLLFQVIWTRRTEAVNCGGMGMTVELRVGPGSDAGVVAICA